MNLIPNEKKYWEFIRQVRNDPEIQVGFVEQVYITKYQQKEYMKKYGKNYFICLDEDEPIGYIGEIKNDIRIAVIKKYQKKGTGKFMLDKFMKLRPDGHAKIKPENTASIRLFESCGFVCTGKDNLFLYYKK